MEGDRAEGLAPRGKQAVAGALNEGLELAERPENLLGAPKLARHGGRCFDVIENHQHLEQGPPGRVRSSSGDREAELMRRV